MEPGGRTTDGATTADRPLPFSRPFAQAGFSRNDSETWRRAGWHDPEEAATWNRLEGDCTPRQLRALHAAGVDPAHVMQVARFTRRHTAAWTRAFRAVPADIDDLLDLAEAERAGDQLREEVLANLRRDAVGSPATASR